MSGMGKYFGGAADTMYSNKEPAPKNPNKVWWRRGWGALQFGGSKAQEQGATLMRVYSGDSQTFPFAAANKMLNIPFAGYKRTFYPDQVGPKA